MSKKVALIVDSTIGFTSKEAAEHGLYLLPNIITCGSKSYRDDGIEINDEKFIELSGEKHALRTSMLNMGEAEQLFSTLSSQYGQLVFIGLSPKLSNQHDQLKLREKEFPKLKVLSSRDACYGIREAVLKAKTRLNNGEWTFEDFQKYIDNKKRSYISIISNLDNLKKSGRISNAKALLGALLRKKILVEYSNDGSLIKMKETSRTMSKAIDLAVVKCKSDLNTKTGKGITLCVEEFEADKKDIEHAISLIKTLMPDCSISSVARAPKSVVCHTGLGFLAIYGQESEK